MTTNTIEGFLYYAKIAEPGLRYQSDETQWSIDVVVDKATAKAWSKQFPKQKHKEVDNDEFERIFKTPPPYSDESEQYIVKVKKDTHYRDKESGELVPVPDQYHPKVFNSDGEDITESTLIGNGSKGVVAYDVNTNSYGSFAKLTGVRVDQLIEYVRPVTDAKAALFGGKPNAASGSKPKRVTAKAVEAEPDDQLPF